MCYSIGGGLDRLLLLVGIDSLKDIGYSVSTESVLVDFAFSTPTTDGSETRLMAYD